MTSSPGEYEKKKELKVLPSEAKQAVNNVAPCTSGHTWPSFRTEPLVTPLNEAFWTVSFSESEALPFVKKNGAQHGAEIESSHLFWSIVRMDQEASLNATSPSVTPGNLVNGGASYIDESESGIEASSSSMASDGDDDSVMDTGKETPLLQRAVRSAKRSAAVKARHRRQAQGGQESSFSDDARSTSKQFGDYRDPYSAALTQEATSTEIDPESRDKALRSLTKEERDMVVAGVDNARHASRDVRRFVKNQDIPTPPSGYEGDSEGPSGFTRHR